MKIQLEAKTYITFSLNIPQEYEQLMSARTKDLSDEEKDKRSDCYDEMYELAREIINNDFKNSSIDNIDVDEIWCNKIH